MSDLHTFGLEVSDRASGKEANSKGVYDVDAATGTPVLVHTWRNTRVPCISRIRSLDMFYHGFNIGTLSEESNDAGEFDWVIRMDWENWEKAGSPEMPGIDVQLRLPEYIRSYIPAIVDQRTLPDTRDRLYEQLAEVGLTYNDRYEYMCRTGGLCGVNNITMRRKDDVSV